MSKLTNADVEKIAATIGHTLPGLYHRLLVELGHGPVGDGAEIYDPLTVRELYEPFFNDPGQLFNPYFPFGCHNRTQDLWIIDGDAEKAASISHETVPEDWPEEEWLSYEAWIKKYLEPEIENGRR